MRFCVSGRQPYSVLKRADEIKVAYNDKDRIMDFIEKLPDKVIILEVSNEDADWTTWQMYSEKFREFHIALHNLSRWKEFADHNIKWYWPYPITSYYELGMIMNLDPSYIMLGPPLTFDLDTVFNLRYYDGSTDQVPVRMVPNNAKPSYLPTHKTDTGIYGQWVRPEDVPIYSTRVDCFEFDAFDLKQEEALLHVYKENGEWPGNLSLLIQNLNFDVDNRAIPEELGERRMTCGQRCWANSSCHLCHSALKFADQLRKEKLRRDAQATN